VSDGVVQFPGQLRSLLKLQLLHQLLTGRAPVADHYPQRRGKQQHGRPADRVSGTREISGDAGQKADSHESECDGGVAARTPPEKRVSQHQHDKSAVQHHRSGASDKHRHIQYGEHSEAKPTAIKGWVRRNRVVTTRPHPRPIATGSQTRSRRTTASNATAAIRIAASTQSRRRRAGGFWSEEGDDDREAWDQRRITSTTLPRAV
jgi:hypothetical protein